MKRKFIKTCCAVAVTSIFAMSLASCKKTYTISFVTNEGSNVENVVFGEGSKLETLAEPTREGYVFGGWYTDPDLQNKFNLNDELPLNDFTLYADWNVKLEFDSRGGSAVEAIIGDPLHPFTMPSDPVREGFVFVGWYKDAALTEAQKTVLPAKNAKCYAKWAVAENSTALTLGEFKVNDASHYVVEGNKFTATKEKGDYSFFASNIDFNVKSYGGVKLEITGTKGVNILVKLEGGGVDAIEKSFTMTGSRQTIIMPVSENNLTSTGSERLLLFLNPGVASCSDTPEYVEVHKAQIIKTVDEDKANQNSAIYFVTNGAGVIDPMFGKIGSDLTMPKDPEKPFSKFVGWYTNKELTEKFENTKYPESTVILYAKWESDVKTVDMLNDTFVENDENTYSFTKNEDGSLVVNKTAAREWAFAKSTLKGEDIKGLGFLKIAVKGTKGQRALFKVNDQGGAGEKWVDFTGEMQYVVIDFSSININENNAALLIFADPEKPETCEFTISHLEFTNVLDSKSILNENEFSALDQDTHKFTYSDNKLNIEKTTDNQYSFIKSNTLTKDIAKYKYLVITLKGQAEEEILFKLYDRVETRVKLTGEVQQVVLELNVTEDLMNNIALLLVLNSEKAGASLGVEFTQIEYFA